MNGKNNLKKLLQRYLECSSCINTYFGVTVGKICSSFSSHRHGGISVSSRREFCHSASYNLGSLCSPPFFHMHTGKVDFVLFLKSSFYSILVGIRDFGLLHKIMSYTVSALNNTDMCQHFHVILLSQ